jgi:hypothetical protein
MLNIAVGTALCAPSSFLSVEVYFEHLRGIAGIWACEISPRDAYANNQTETQMPPKGKYTEPELRDEVKEEVRRGGKGGAPGQWSARKVGICACI